MHEPLRGNVSNNHRDLAAVDSHFNRVGARICQTIGREWLGCFFSREGGLELGYNLPKLNTLD